MSAGLCYSATKFLRHIGVVHSNFMSSLGRIANEVMIFRSALL